MGIMMLALSIVVWGMLILGVRSMFKIKIKYQKPEQTRPQAAAPVPAIAPQPRTPHLRNAVVYTAKGVAKAIYWTAPRLLAGCIVSGKNVVRAYNQAKTYYIAKAAKAAAARPEMATPASPVFTRDEVEQLEIPTFMRKQEEKNSKQYLH